jgi:hypothetical protein
MLDAFIVDQLKKAEEERWIEDQRLILELPCEPQKPPKKSDDERGVQVIRM